MSAALYIPQNVGLFGQSDVDFSAALASYSADTIPNATIRKPFEMDGKNWVCTSSSGSGYNPYTCSSIRVYRLIPAGEFDGVATTYGDRTKEAHQCGDEVRKNFYDGIQVRHGGRSLVLVGPAFELLSQPTVIARGRDLEDEDSYTGFRDPRNDRWDLEEEDYEDDDCTEQLSIGLVSCGDCGIALDRAEESECFTLEHGDYCGECIGKYFPTDGGVFELPLQEVRRLSNHTKQLTMF